MGEGIVKMRLCANRKKALGGVFAAATAIDPLAGGAHGEGGYRRQLHIERRGFLECFQLMYLIPQPFVLIC